MKNISSTKTLIVLLIIVACAIYPVLFYSSSETVEITIKDKERITTGKGENLDSKFIIYTNNEVFKNTDELLFFKFNSADFQNNLEVGKTYTVKVVGWRVPFLSMYRNIVRYEK